MRKFLVLVVICLAVVVAIGWSRGWFALSTSQDQRNDQVDIDLRVDRAKVRSDVSAARERAEELGKSAAKQAEKLVKPNESVASETASGIVTEIRHMGKELDIRTTADRSLSFVVQEGAEIASDGGTVALESLKPGQHVRIDFQVSRGKNVARRITIQRTTDSR
jgi:hypothetical protein